MADWHHWPLKSAYRVLSSCAAILRSSAASKFWKIQQRVPQGGFWPEPNLNSTQNRLISRQISSPFISKNRFPLPATVFSQWINTYWSLLDWETMPYSRVKKFFFNSESFETCCGLIPRPLKSSYHKVSSSHAAEQCCLKVLKIQKRGYPREILRSVRKFKFFLEPPYIKANFLLFSYLNIVYRCRWINTYWLLLD